MCLGTIISRDGPLLLCFLVSLRKAALMWCILYLGYLDYLRLKEMGSVTRH